MAFMARRAKPPPVTFLTSDGVWPLGPFRDDSPPYVAAVANLARNVMDEAGRRGLSQRGLARDTGVTLATINHIYTGKVIPDTATLATLEHALGVALWFGPHPD